MTRAIRTSVSVVAALACCCALIAAGPLWTYGAGARQWFVRPVPADGDAPATWAVSRREGKRVVDVASIGRAPAQFADFGDRLAILSADGGWSLASGDGVVAGPALPGDRVPLAIASGRGVLWFLTGHGDARALVTWDGRSFADAGKVPDARPPAVDARLLVTRSSVIVASRVAGGIEVQSKDDAGWRVAGAPIDAQAAWLAQDERRGPLLICRAGASWTIRAIARDGAIGPAATLAVDPKAGDASPAVVEGDVRVAWSDGDELVEQSFDPSNRAVGPPTRAKPMLAADAQAPSVLDRAASWVGLLAMGVVLMTAGRPRPGDAPPAGRSAAGDAAPTPASLARRLAAGLIDAWPLYVACAYVALTSDRPEAELVRLDAARDRLIVVAGSAAYALIAMLCEWRWQRTLGKLIFGLRVVDVSGARPTVRAIAIRNVLRLLDLNLITLLIVPLSRQRQRLGDLVARTLVVDALADPAPAKAPEANGADEKR